MHLVRDRAAAASIDLSRLPSRAPELNPGEDLWRLLKATIATDLRLALLRDFTQSPNAFKSASRGSE